MARPIEYSAEIFQEIFDRMAGGESVRAICADDRMPHRATFFRWIARDEELCDQYARACEARAHCYADEIVDIADTPVVSIKRKRTPVKDKETGEVVDYAVEETEGDNVERTRQMIDARKWFAGQVHPKKYGARAQQEDASAGTQEQALRELAKDDDDGPVAPDPSDDAPGDVAPEASVGLCPDDHSQ